MREIKFRIWDTENKEMLKVQELDFEPTFYGGRIAIRPDQYNDYFDTEDMILMQYIGLHDKNGKEIYEGDIVRKFNGIIGKVIYEHSEFIIDVTNNKKLDYGRLDLIENFVEVIGNIYDNPDLLEKGAEDE